MKSSSGSKGDGKDLLIAEDMTRREFLRAGVGLGGVASGLQMIAGCVTAETPKGQITPAKDKSDYKIYPPKEGCVVGFYKKESMSTIIINYYKDTLGARPSILVWFDFLDSGFPMTEADTIKKNGIMPYITILPGWERRRLSFDPDDIVQGRGDRYIKRLAKDAVQFGEKHGVFFFTTMIEPNVDWWYWSRKPNTTPAWRRIWQIFEDQEANQYATWVWEAFSPTRYGFHVTDPERYYPGDKYIDWIGLNVFANLKNRYISENTMFSELMSKTYEQMLRNHPEKPIMVSEFGRTPGYNQPAWLIDAYRSIKNDFPTIKAAIYYDNITPILTGQDHTLDQKSLNTLKEVFKDPYWIMAKSQEVN